VVSDDIFAVLSQFMYAAGIDATKMVSVNSSWGTSDLERERSWHKIQPRLVACHCFIHQSVFHNFVEDFIIRIITSPFLYLSPTMVAQGEK